MDNLAVREGRGGGKEANKKQSEQQLKFVKMPGGSSPPHHRAGRGGNDKELNDVAQTRKLLLCRCAAQPEWFVLEMRQLRFYTEDREDRPQPHLQQLPSELPKIVSCIV